MSWTHHKRPYKRKRVDMDDNQKSRDALDDYIRLHNPRYIIGIDEVAWGAISGPLVIGCVVYDTNYRNEQLKDSKRYTTERARQRAAALVKASALWHAVHYTYPAELKANGPAACLQNAYRTVASVALANFPDSVIVLDGVNGIKNLYVKQLVLPKADAVCTAVSAASILAKVDHDNYMNQLHAEFPEFDWYANKGYPTSKHIELLRKYGVTQHHRLNVQLVAKIQKIVGDYKENQESEAEAAE